MNKMSFSRLFASNKKSEGIRKIYKSRNNPKQSYEAVPSTLNRQFSLSQSKLALQQGQNKSIEQVKDYVRSRFKTQYSDNFHSKTLHSKQPHHPNSSINSLLNPLQYVKTTNRSDKVVASAKPINQDTNEREKHLRVVENSVQQDNQQQDRVVQRLQRDLEEALQKRLKKCLGFNQSSEWNRLHSMEDLLDIVSGLKTNPENKEEDIEESNRKIVLLQKIMAQNSVEADILKKYYFSKISQKHQHTNKTASLIIPEINTTPQSYNPLKEQVSLVKSTVHREVFQKPNKTAYVHDQQSFEPSNSHKLRQPLPRSSYDRQFLNYRGLTPIPASRPQESKIIGSPLSSKNLASSYKRQFVPKQAQKIDLKQLDACKDKIKDLPISFSKRTQDKLISKLNNFLSKKKEIKSELKTEIPFLQNALLTESRRQFKKPSYELPSKIKHQNYQKFKYQYKNNLCL